LQRPRTQKIKAKQLYFQDRSFGFAVLQLIISRLVENNERLLQGETGELVAVDSTANRSVWADQAAA